MFLIFNEIFIYLYRIHVILRILSFVFYTLVGCKSKEDVRDRTGSETSLNIIYFSAVPASGSRDSRLSMTSRWG